MNDDEFLPDAYVYGFLAFLAAVGFTLLLALAGGCAHVQPTPVLNQVPQCAAPAKLAPEQGCPGMFTASGAPCVRCGIGGGCFDTASQVYCVQDSCTDARCAAEPADIAGARR